MTDKQWDRVWFVSRVLVGMLIHFILLLCTVALTEVVIELTLTLDDIKQWRLLWGVMAGAAAFFAGLAGARWVREQYITFFLPEAFERDNHR